MPPPPTPADTTILGAVRALDPRSDIERAVEGLDGLAIAGDGRILERAADRLNDLPRTSPARTPPVRARAAVPAACRSSSASGSTRRPLARGRRRGRSRARPFGPRPGRPPRRRRHGRGGGGTRDAVILDKTPPVAFRGRGGSASRQVAVRAVDTGTRGRAQRPERGAKSSRPRQVSRHYSLERKRPRGARSRERRDARPRLRGLSEVGCEDRAAVLDASCN